MLTYKNKITLSTCWHTPVFYFCISYHRRIEAQYELTMKCTLYYYMLDLLDITDFSLNDHCSIAAMCRYIAHTLIDIIPIVGSH